MEHVFQIRLVFGSAAIFAAYEAMKARRWQRYVFWVATVAFAVIAFGWQWLHDVYAPATQFVTEVAVSPSTWVVLFALAMLAVWVSAHGLRSEAKPRESPTLVGRAVIPPVSTPELARELRDRLSKLEGRVEDLSQVRGQFENTNAKQLAAVVNSVRDEYQAADKKLREGSVAQLQTFAHNADGDLNKLLAIAEAICATAVFDKLIREAPVLPTVLQEPAFGSVRDFIASCEAAFMHLRWYSKFGNLMKHAEKKADHELESSPPAEFAEATDKLAFRKRQIARTQADDLLTYVHKYRREAQEFLYENAPMITERISNREKRVPNAGG